MYNIDLYSYWNKPFSENKKFSVHPLDEPGKEKYYSDQSHCVHYLKRTDPFVFKQIVGVDYDTLVQQQKDDIKMMQDLKEKGFGTKDQKHVNFEETKNQEGIQYGTHLSEYQKNQRNNNFNEEYNIPDNYENYDNYRQNRTIGHSQTFRPYNKWRDFKATYGYDNHPVFKSNGDRYAYAIKGMKKGGRETFVKPKRRYDGFTVDDPPVIENARPNMTDAFRSYNERLNQSVGRGKMQNRITLNDQELRRNLFNQTSQNFLKKRHLPDIVKIADTRQIIRKQKIGLSKEMGEKYDPYSLIPPSKNRTGRNFVGDLFKH